MVVDEAHRGQRIGEDLVRHAESLARAAGCYKLTLTSNKRRTDAHRFYERLGFARTHEAFRINL
jgi:GNAT superfamily N-acetyltransferase